MNEENLSTYQKTPSFIGSEKNILILDKIIKWSIYILVALFPLWFLPITSNILNLDKQILMVGILSVALIAWLGRLFSQENISWYRGLIALFFLAFVVIYGLSTIFSIQPYESLMGTDAHSSRVFINVIYFFVLFLLLVNYINVKREEKGAQILKFLTVFLVSSALAGIIGILQIWGKFIFPWRFTKVLSFNTVGTVTSFGIFLIALLPLVFSLLLSVKRWGKGGTKKTALIAFRTLLIILAIMGILTIIFLNFRVLWIVTAVGMIVLIGFWLSKRYILSTQSLSWLAIPVVILALCLIFFLFKPGNLFNLKIPLELGLTHKGGWSIDKEVIQHNPILGSGPGTFIYNYSLYKPKSINQTIFWNLRFINAPSEILSLFSEIGILGLISFLALIAVFLYTIIKNLARSGEGLAELAELKIGLFSSWLVLALAWFLYPQNLTLMFVFWLFFTFLVIITAQEKDISIVSLKSSGRTALIASFGFIIAIIIVIGLLYFEGSKFVAEAEYKAGLELIRGGKLNDGINKVVRATVVNPYEDKFYRTLAQLFLVQINQNLNNRDLKKDEQARRVQIGISNTINSAVRATILNPNNVLNWIARGSAYRNLITLVDGAGDWAIKSYEESLKREPTNPFLYTEIARTHVAIADLLKSKSQKQQDEETKKQIAEHLNKAVDAYGQAIKLKPNYAPAHYEIALVYDRQGKIKEAIAKMESNRMYNPQDTGIAFQLAVLYYKDSQFEKAKQEFQRAVKLDPKYSNARYFLGLLYDREGNKQAAIEQFEKIAELNPDNKSVKQILANLKAGKPALGSPGLGPKQPEKVPIEEKQSSEESKFQLPK